MVSLHHVGTSTLADGDYEVIQEPEGEVPEVQANVIEIAEDPSQRSEEPKAANSVPESSEGSPGHIPNTFTYATYNSFTDALGI